MSLSCLSKRSLFFRANATYEPSETAFPGTFLRLIVPYIAWPSIFYIINYLSTDRRTEKYSLKDIG